MSAKQITVPLEVYVRLQELASLAGYSYREAGPHQRRGRLPAR